MSYGFTNSNMYPYMNPGWGQNNVNTNQNMGSSCGSHNTTQTTPSSPSSSNTSTTSTGSNATALPSIDQIRSDFTNAGINLPTVRQQIRAQDAQQIDTTLGNDVSKISNSAEKNQLSQDLGTYESIQQGILAGGAPTQQMIPAMQQINSDFQAAGINIQDVVNQQKQNDFPEAQAILKSDISHVSNTTVKNQLTQDLNSLQTMQQQSQQTASSSTNGTTDPGNSTEQAPSYPYGWTQNPNYPSNTPYGWTQNPNYPSNTPYSLPQNPNYPSNTPYSLPQNPYMDPNQGGSNGNPLVQAIYTLEQDLSAIQSLQAQLQSQGGYGNGFGQYQGGYNNFGGGFVQNQNAFTGGYNGNTIQQSQAWFQNQNGYNNFAGNYGQ